jgi:hypothetical protein
VPHPNFDMKINIFADELKKYSLLPKHILKYDIPISSHF